MEVVLNVLPYANVLMLSTVPAAFQELTGMIQEDVNNALPPASVTMNNIAHPASWACPSMFNKMCACKFVGMDW